MTTAASAKGRDFDGGIGATLQACMIWSAEVIPVSVEREGLPIADVSSQGDADFTDLHAAFLRVVMLDRAPDAARLHIFAHTRYRLVVNGVPLGRGPCRYETRRPEYDSWDIAPHLKPGRNTVAILAHRDAPSGRIMAHPPGMAAVLDLGVAGRIVTGPDWLAVPDRSFGPRAIAWASIEETVDARAMPDWTSPAFDPMTLPQPWPAAVSVACDVAPVPRGIPLLRERRQVITETRFPLVLGEGESLSLPLSGIVLAFVRLHLEAAPGCRLTLGFALPEGQTSGATRYITRDGAQVYETGDVFALDRLILTVEGGPVTLQAVEIVELLYPFDRVGRFRSSDPDLDRLWEICARTLELISEDSWTDCADRERVEWTDETPPAFECTRVMMAGPSDDGAPLWADPRLLRGLLQRMILTQRPDGQIKAHSCSERWDIHAVMEDRSCDWMIALRQYVDVSGDLDFLRSVWPAIPPLMDWFLRRRTARGLVNAREWEVWDNPLRYQLCEGAGLNCFVVQALRNAAWAGRTLGEDAAARSFDDAADALVAAINTHLWSEAEGSYFAGLFGAESECATQLNDVMFDGPFLPGNLFRPTLQAALFALEFGIVPDGRRARVEAFVLAHAQEAEAVMTHHFLFRRLVALDRQEEDRLMIGMLRRGWQAMTASPWGTAWEDLEGRGSRVHVYGMAPAWLLSAHVLGVHMPDGPVRDAAIRIAPHPCDLRWAEGVVVTEHGPVALSWQAEDGAIRRLEVEIPPGASAELLVPVVAGDGGRRRERSLLGPGKHVWAR